MKNLKLLSDDGLEIEIKKLVSREREILSQLLSHLREVELRRLYLKRGCGSLFEYCRRVLSYSESEASLRISAMRLSREIPEIVEKIESGHLSLTNVASVHYFFKREEKAESSYSAEEKREILQKVENSSKRDCEKILLCLSPESALPKERERLVAPDHTELKFIANDEVMKKLAKLRSLISHQKLDPSLSELFELMLNDSLKLRDPEQKGLRKRKNRSLEKTKKLDSPFSEKGAEQNLKSTFPEKGVEQNVKSNFLEKPARLNLPAMVETTQNIKVAFPEKVPPSQTSQSKIRSQKISRYIPSQLKAKVWAKAQGKCQHRDPISGEKCQSTFQLQVDHKMPLALGGTNNLDNLELVCRSHNLLRATQTLGKEFMQNYWV